MKVVGLTGGIGSGKTTVLKMFQDLKVPIYIADLEAKKLMQSSDEIKRKMIQNFGNLAYINKKLNTSYIADIVFNNIEKLQVINQIVHPVVKADFLLQKKSYKSSYLIFENAILFENGFDKLCDYIITITAPLEERIKRVQLRDNLTKDQIMSRVNNQWTDEQKVKNSDFVIENVQLQKTQKKVIEIHQYLLKNIDSNSN